MANNRKIGVMVGSKSDLSQCQAGLQSLRNAVSEGLVEVPFVIINSIHRNTDEVLENLLCIDHFEEVDVLIVGAGWANHLSGTVDAYLRNSLQNNHIVVYAIAFEDSNNEDHTLAAILSITEVPSFKGVFRDYIGSAGFLKACEDAVSDPLEKIKLPESRPTVKLSLDEALV